MLSHVTVWPMQKKFLILPFRLSYHSCMALSILGGHLSVLSTQSPPLPTTWDTPL